jgi:hypothetical protein
MVILDLLLGTSSLLAVKATQAFFFFFGIPLPEDKWEDWINDDGFEGKPWLNESKKYLFDELAKAKEEFKDFLKSNELMNESVSKKGGAKVVSQYIHAHAIRIKKIRLVIQFKVYFNVSKNAYGTKYLIAKSCWINNQDGKVIKKFSKVVGPEKQVKNGGKVPSGVIDEVQKELEATMWSEYVREYRSLNQ